MKVNRGAYLCIRKKTRMGVITNMIAALKGDPKEIATFLMEMEGRRSGGTYKVEVQSEIDGKRILENFRKDFGSLLRREDFEAK